MRVVDCQASHTAALDSAGVADSTLRSCDDGGYSEPSRAGQKNRRATFTEATRQTSTKARLRHVHPPAGLARDQHDEFADNRTRNEHSSRPPPTSSTEVPAAAEQRQHPAGLARRDKQPLRQPSCIIQLTAAHSRSVRNGSSPCAPVRRLGEPRPGAGDFRGSQVQLFDLDAVLSKERRRAAPESSTDCATLLQTYADRGRSAPAPNSPNTGEVDIWKAGKASYAPALERRPESNFRATRQTGGSCAIVGL